MSHRTNSSGYRGQNSNRESPSSRRSSQQSSSSYNGGGATNHLKAMPAATMRNVSPTSISSITDDFAHLNIPNGEVPIGSIVQCTQGDRVYKGEVIGFDGSFKAMILKSASSSNKTSLNDCHILNLCQLKELKVITECKEKVADPPSLNTQKLHNRHRDQVDRKRRLVMAFKSGILPEGQKLFLTISKTIEDITWKGDSIEVLREVLITPPYRPENVKGNQDSQSLKHVRKIVEKHINDQMLQAKQQPDGRANNDQATLNNNNLKGNETPLPNTQSQQVGGTSPHQPVSRNLSSNRYEDGKGGGRGQRQTGGGRTSTQQKRDYESSSKFTQPRKFQRGGK